MSNKEIARQIESIDGMVRALEKTTDPVLRTKAQDLVQALMELHGSCLEQMLEIVRSTGEAGKPIIEKFGDDQLVRSLLLLYGLHPVDLQTRVLQALDKTRPYQRSHGGNVELVSLDDAGVVTLRLTGSCDGCGSSSATLKQAVEEAIYEAAPDVTGIEVPGLEAVKTAAVGFVPLASLQGQNLLARPANPGIQWVDALNPSQEISTIQGSAT
ncbi:MAG: NifU family protein [Candidatus Acidiferrum sp.]